MESKTLTYYHWDDVEQYICDELKIPTDKFRYYHDIVGGEYKDWWHIWMTINYDNIRNGGYETVWFDVCSIALSKAQKEYGDWVMALSPILDKMEKEFGDSIVVLYSW